MHDRFPYGSRARQRQRAGGFAYGVGAADPFADVLEILGDDARLWVYTSGISADVEEPVDSWGDVTGAATLTRPGAASKSPTLKSDGVDFDGIDDALWVDGAPAWMTPFLSTSGATGATIGFASVEVGVGTAAGDRALTAFESTGSFESWVPGTFQLQQTAFPSYFSVQASTVGLVTFSLPYGTLLPGSRYIDSTQDEDDPARWGSAVSKITRLVIGSEYTATGRFWDGRISAIWITPRELDSSTVSDLHAALAALGL